MGSEVESWTGMDSGALEDLEWMLPEENLEWMSMPLKKVCMAQTYKMSTAITGRIDRVERISEIARLESVEDEHWGC